MLALFALAAAHCTTINLAEAKWFVLRASEVRAAVGERPAVEVDETRPSGWMLRVYDSRSCPPACSPSRLLAWFGVDTTTMEAVDVEGESVMADRGLERAQHALRRRHCGV